MYKLIINKVIKKRDAYIYMYTMTYTEITGVTKITKDSIKLNSIYILSSEELLIKLLEIKGILHEYNNTLRY